MRKYKFLDKLWNRKTRNYHLIVQIPGYCYGNKEEDVLYFYYTVPFKGNGRMIGRTQIQWSELEIDTLFKKVPKFPWE
ncbi:MAG TPA: hypothetical protein VI911_09095 [Patescibacteria group bacterium]|nr:MAG: hypothetical protein UR43_C0005G0013 [candidate division TM6 bacterium GW2011_GWF2_33_332]OGI30973.1 MAG: hypothetical protein A2343_03695 [Candidatus Moranbacteria bacterium RIFOXYB12_FULL_35_8]HLD91154.1 hypothetical protein [Patescibacteria group bacterium]